MRSQTTGQRETAPQQFSLWTQAGVSPQPNFDVNIVVNFVDEVDDNVDDEDPSKSIMRLAEANQRVLAVDQ